MSCKCNKIRIVGTSYVGNTIDNPFTIQELYEASKLNEWDCVETQDGVNYYIHSNIEVGDGSNFTALIIKGKNLIFDAGKSIIPNPPCYIEVSSVWTQTEKEFLFSKLDKIGSDIEKVGSEVKKGPNMLEVC